LEIFFKVFLFYEDEVRDDLIGRVTISFAWPRTVGRSCR